jgi:hypothetical protein
VALVPSQRKWWDLKPSVLSRSDIASKGRAIAERSWTGLHTTPALASRDRQNPRKLQTGYTVSRPGIESSTPWIRGYNVTAKSARSMKISWRWIQRIAMLLDVTPCSLVAAASTVTLCLHASSTYIQSEDGESTFLRNVTKLLPDCTASQETISYPHIYTSGHFPSGFPIQI